MRNNIIHVHKPLPCRLGFHRIDKTGYVEVRKRRGRHKWHRNYAVCQRCGCLVYAVKKMRV